MTEAADSTGGGTVLYRGETPDAVGFDVHGGYGQAWTTDYEHAACYARGDGGRIRKALLPLRARRMVLVDPSTDDYNWDGVAGLERLLDAPVLDVVRALRTGWQLSDLWSEEWTCLVQQAGYDSIATVGIEGPEEYVLNPHILMPLDTFTTGQEVSDAS